MTDPGVTRIPLKTGNLKSLTNIQRKTAHEQKTESLIPVIKQITIFPRWLPSPICFFRGMLPNIKQIISYTCNII